MFEGMGYVSKTRQTSVKRHPVVVSETAALWMQQNTLVIPSTTIKLPEKSPRERSNISPA